MRYETIAVYIMASKPNGTLYIGVTSDLIARSHQHRTGTGSEFTQKYGVHQLAWYELHATMESAIRREKRLKKYTRVQKIKLIQTLNPEWQDLFETIV